jgi:hypothetical protein
LPEIIRAGVTVDECRILVSPRTGNALTRLQRSYARVVVFLLDGSFQMWIRMKRIRWEALILRVYDKVCPHVVRETTGIKSKERVVTLTVERGDTGRNVGVRLGKIAAGSWLRNLFVPGRR